MTCSSDLDAEGSCSLWATMLVKTVKLSSAIADPIWESRDRYNPAVANLVQYGVRLIRKCLKWIAGTIVEYVLKIEYVLQINVCLKSQLYCIHKFVLTIWHIESLYTTFMFTMSSNMYYFMTKYIMHSFVWIDCLKLMFTNSFLLTFSIWTVQLAQEVCPHH